MLVLALMTCLVTVALAQDATVNPPGENAADQAKEAFAEGQQQFAHRNFEAAAISFSKAAQLKPDWAEPLVERAKVYMKLSLFTEAIHSCDQAIRLKPNDPAMLNLRGYAHYSISKFSEAITDFDEAIRLDPAMADAYRNRGNAKWQKGDKAGANADFAQAKALQSGKHGPRKTRSK